MEKLIQSFNTEFIVGVLMINQTIFIIVLNFMLRFCFYCCLQKHFAISINTLLTPYLKVFIFLNNELNIFK